MNLCEPFQQQLLEDLYGLLDEAESRALREHLEGCAACRTARERADVQRRLLAAAAKEEFPGVRFTPPVARPETPPVIALAPRRRRWVRWAVAAAVLLLVAGLGGSAGWSWYGHQDEVARAEAERRQALEEKNRFAQQGAAERERAARELREIQEQIRLLEVQWTGEADQARKAANARQLQVIISGPKTLQPGAPNRYNIETRDRNNAPKSGTVHVNIVDAKSNKEVFRKDVACANGNAVLDLPPDLPLTPGTQLALKATAEAQDGVLASVSEQLPLVAPVYLTHLTTDRPMYRPGEVVRFRSLTLERFSLKPARDDLHLRYRITDPNGAEVFKLEGSAQVVRDGVTVQGPDGKPVQGVGAGEFRIPPGAAGGEYTLAVSEGRDRFPAEKRKFLVNHYQAPRLNKELEFTRKSYGPGDEVEATCKVARAEGGTPLVNQPVVATVHVDGRPCPVSGGGTLRTDAQGNVPPVRFKLPEQIERGEGTLAVQFTDGGNHETVVRPVPIVLKKLLIEFFPEGGDLVAGVPNRVYFQARTTLNKPAELRGRVVDAQGATVAALQTLNDDALPGVNQGMGAFEFVPEAGRAYELKIDTPIGVEGRYSLPAARPDGVVLNIPTGVVTDKIHAVVRSAGSERRLLVGVYCRGRLLDHATVVARPGEATPVTLKPAATVSGVYRVTVFEERPGAAVSLVPVAERLIYRRTVQELHLGITPDKAAYNPGDPVKLSLTAADEREQATPAVLVVSVVDQSIVKLADEKTARTMPTHFYLGTEVRKAEDLEFADFLLTDHPKAAAALDLLLGTQGWRRFAEQDPEQFRDKQRQDADRLLVASGQSTPKVANLAELDVKKVEEKFAPQWLALQTRLGKKEADEEQRDQRQAAELPRFEGRIGAAQANLNAATARVRDFNRTLGQAVLAALLLVLLVVGIGGLVIGLVRASGEHRGALPYFATGLGALVLLFLGGGAATVYYFQATAQHQQEVALAREGAKFAPAPMAAQQKNEEKAWPEAGMADGGVRALPAPGVDRLGEELNAAPQGALHLQEQEKVALGKMNAPGRPDAAQADFFNRDANLGVKQMDEPARLADLALKVEAKGANGVRAFAFQPMEKDLDRQAAAGLRGGDIGGFGAGFAGGFGRGLGGEAGEQEREMRRLGQFQQLATERLRRRVELPPTPQPLVVREYAHHHERSTDNVRRDFAETVYWHPVLVLPGGKGEAAFELPDSTTTFQVVAWGHTLDGRLGAATAEVVSRLPFSLEPKLPTEVTSSDKVTIPVTVANDTTSKRSIGIHAEATGLTLLGSADRQLAVDADRRVRQLFQCQPSLVDGLAKVRFRGRCEPFGADTVERSFKVVPEGFPIVGAQSDVLEGMARHVITLPDTWVKGTLQCQVQLFPSTLADLQKGLEGLLREPCGCFEQTSTSNYPNVLILSYLKESAQSRPEIEQRARQLLDRGYKQLTSFECLAPDKQAKREGYEWFGGTAPPHEALTAYGLLEFRDMAKVHPVDAVMLQRTHQYLLGQRDGKGGFKRNPRALDTFGRAPDHITSAYIVWALTEGGADDPLQTELAALYGQARTSKDPYFLALVGTSLLNRGKTAEGVDLCKALAGAQKEDGHLEAAQTSITGSGGRDLQIETTALATLAWLKANRPAEFHTSVHKAVQWLGKQRGGYGGFGSTQATILALKALIAFTRENRKTAEAGDLKLFLNGGAEPVAVKHFAAGTLEPVVVQVPQEELLRPGANQVRVEVTGKNTFPYTLSWSYQTLTPASAENCPVHVSTKLDRAAAVEGETVRLSAVVENKSGKGQGMAVAILGLPGGLALPEDMRQLKDLARLRDNDTRPGVISAWELRGRELVLYWRDLAPDQRVEVNLDLVCRIPGEYRGPASRAYLYYNADHKYWVGPLAVAITPKAD
jgi:hypothetical protein